MAPIPPLRRVTGFGGGTGSGEPPDSGGRYVMCVSSTALRAGHTPPEMAGYPKELLQRIADGDESLYSKRLLPPEAAEMRVHVTVSQNGAVIDDEELTPEHPSTQSFPAGRNSPTLFHFTVEQPGPSRQVTCWVKSENSGAAYTRPMGQGQSDDLQARAQ